MIASAHLSMVRPAPEVSLLISRCWSLEQAESGGMERRRWTNQTKLAVLLGTVPDVLSRVVRQLTKAGLIEMDRQQIRILDRAGLTDRAISEDE